MISNCPVLLHTKDVNLMKIVIVPAVAPSVMQSGSPNEEENVHPLLGGLDGRMNLIAASIPTPTAICCRSPRTSSGRRWMLVSRQSRPSWIESIRDAYSDEVSVSVDTDRHQVMP